MIEKTFSSVQDPVRIALWGAGGVYRAYESELLEMQAKGEIQIVAVADSNVSAKKGPNGIPLVHPGELNELDFQYALIMSGNNLDEIKEQAFLDYHIDEDRLLTYGILKLPKFDFPRYHALRAACPSIVSNSFWGMAVFRALQMDIRSPFSGTRIREHDYLKMLNAFEEYSNERSLAFLGWRLDAYGRRYLAAVVGDINLRFFEPHTEESALKTWLAGCSILNKQYTIVQMSTLDPASERQFDELTGFRRKICFVPYKTEVASSMQVPLESSHHVYELSIEREVEGGLNEVSYDLLDMFLDNGKGRMNELEL